MKQSDAEHRFSQPQYPCNRMKLLLLLPALVALLITGCDRAESAVASAPAGGNPATSVPTPPATSTNVAKGSTNSPAAEAKSGDVAPPAPPPELPAGVQEVVQLAQNTLGEQVLIDFVATIDKPYSLTADHVIYLKDLGIPETVIAALLKRQVALGGEPVDLPPTDLADAGTTNAAAEPKLALTNAPGANPGLAAAPVPAPIQPNAPTLGETPGIAAPFEPVSPPAATVNYHVFYNSLSPYGTWVEVSDYGWCWQPTVATINVGWRPYCDNGRWLWTSGGWYWHSYYSWGWAPFHYGRWCHVPARGWCWTPGTTWGPSWVTWRHCDDHFGWAPLPPACGWRSGVGLTYHGSGISVGFSFGLGANDFCFVPRARFYDPHCYRYRVAHHDGVGIFNRSTVVNNYTVGDNNTVIINSGIGRDTVQRHSRSEIRPVALASAQQPGRSRESGGRAASPDRIEVYRPTIPVNAIGTRPPETVLARQEGRPAPLVGRTGPSTSAGIFSSRPALHSQTTGGSGTRTEIRPSVSEGTSRPSFPAQQIPSPRAGHIVSRPGANSPSRAADYTMTTPNSGTRSEARPVATRPENPSTPITRPAIGARVESRTSREIGSVPGQVSVRPAPGSALTGVARPFAGRTEARPLPQQQITVRRDSPVAVQPQPTAGVSQPTYVRPDPTSRYAPVPATRPQPTSSPAPAQSQPAFQPRMEYRPQFQRAPPQTAPQPSAPVRSYPPPAQAVPGGGGGRPSVVRPQPQ
jgi:hypothetical protein